MIQLSTAQLTLREFTREDFGDVFVYESDPEVVQYLSYGPYTREECHRDFAWHEINQQASPRHYYHLAITEKANNRAIGWCGVQFEKPDHHEAELGYALHRDYWGRGYMTEAAHAVMSFAFSELDIYRIYGECRPENKGSVRILEKLGMSQEAHLRENLWFKGRSWDTLIFGLLKHEWRR